MTTTTLYKILSSKLYSRGHNKEVVDSQGNLTFFEQEFQVMPKILKFDDDVSDIIDELFIGLSLNHPVYDHHFKKAFLMRFVNRQINRQTVEAFMMQLGYVFLNHEDYLNRVYEDMDIYLSQKSTSNQDNTQDNKQTNETDNVEENNQNNVSDSKQENKQNTQQETTGESTSDNRQARSDLPQNNVQIDVDNTIMTSAKENDISRNKDRNNNQTVDETIGETIGNTKGQADSKTVGNTKGKADSKTVGNTKGETHSYRLDELFKINNILERVFNDFDRQCFMQVW